MMAPLEAIAKESAKVLQERVSSEQHEALCSLLLSSFFAGSVALCRDFNIFLEKRK